MASNRTARSMLAMLAMRAVRAGRVALGAAALGLAVAGCRGSGTRVLDPPSEPARFTSVSLERSPVPAAAPVEDALAFEDRLHERTDEFEGAAGPLLTIEYRILRLGGGGLSERWFAPDSDGAEDLITVEVVFRDADRNVLARIQAFGTLGDSLFGSLDSTLARTADEVAEYALAHFLVHSAP